MTHISSRVPTPASPSEPLLTDTERECWDSIARAMLRLYSDFYRDVRRDWRLRDTPAACEMDFVHQAYRFVTHNWLDSMYVTRRALGLGSP